MPRVAQQEIDDRRRKIMALVRDRSYLPVGELCLRFKISQATARRDLVALSKQESVVRTFGGAMADYDRRFIPFSNRLKLSVRAKAKIAAAAASLLVEGMTVFLDAGTTLFNVADCLCKKPLALRVVTNSLAVAERLMQVKKIRVDLLGGQLLASQSVLLGDEACRAASFYRFDLALLGAEGFDSMGVWNSAKEVVALQKAIMKNAARHAICADAQKSGKQAPALLIPWKKLDLLITDALDVPVDASHVMKI